MKKILTADDLHLQIRELEARNFIQGQQLREAALEFYDSLKPINIIKRGLHNLTTTPGIKNGFVKTAVGLGIGLLTNRILPTKSKGFVGTLGGIPILYNLTKYFVQKIPFFKKN